MLLKSAARVIPDEERVQFLSNHFEAEADDSAPVNAETEQLAPRDEADGDERVAEDAAIEADGFGPLGLSEPILRALHDKGYLRPTPIQAQAIPTVLMGRDVLGCAQTGTGKTAGFTLPLLDILSGSRARARMPRSLILEPTRELALQVSENFVAYGKYLKLNHALLIGGESMSDQRDALTKGVDVLIATPGRLIDLFERGGLLLTDVRVLVIDEADRMLDMGFIPDIERIVAMLPRKRQTLFFSATMAPEIRRLADAFLQNPKEITVSKPASVATTITAGLALVAGHDKREALRRLVRAEEVQNALIFCNRKRDVDVLHKSLTKHHFSAGALHGDLPQSVRFATLEKFKAGEIRLLVCSDVAARGIDIGGLSHVFNFDVPHHAEDYVHRIGRTGRAGKEGRAFTIATPEDRLAVEAIEKLIAAPIPRITVEGLDEVEWAEDDGRRGRGRGRGKPAAKAPARAAPRDEPRRDRPAPERSERPARDRPARPPRDVPPAAREVPARDEHRRRERGVPDQGGNVVGFGADVPAFMLIRKRGPMTQLLDEPSDVEEADVIDEGTPNAEIAA
jgi:superfamily II DNA/RNA helicase